MQYFMGPRDEKNSGILLLALVFYHFGLPSLSNLLNCHLPPITASRSALHVGDKIKEPKKKTDPRASCYLVSGNTKIERKKILAF